MINRSRSRSFVSGTSSINTLKSPMSAIKYAHQAEKLSHVAPDPSGQSNGSAAVEAKYITPQDPIIITADGGRLPEVPLEEANKLNDLKLELEYGDALEEDDDEDDDDDDSEHRLQEGGKSKKPSKHGANTSTANDDTVQKSSEGSLRKAMPPSRTNPLFPPLPLYGPPSILRDLECTAFRTSSFFLSLGFLAVIVLGSAFTSIPLMFQHVWLRLTFRDPDARRPFNELEKQRRKVRLQKEQEWRKRQSRRNSLTKLPDDNEDDVAENGGYIPTEGGPDRLVCDAAYYARRVGLDIEEFKVQTEDGFIIRLWHVYDPREFTPLSDEERSFHGPDLFSGNGPNRSRGNTKGKKPRFPVLLIHGLLQSAGAYCTNDDNSLAFYLCKQGYDVWLGNNRCGFNPEHTLLDYADPRMWAWNIRQMGVLDLPALVSRVLSETGFAKLGLVCHSQGTTQTFVALAKEQRPDLGDKITVFCALAPAAYAGPLIGKMYFKFMRVISPAFFRMFFGIHAFIPFMMSMHAMLPGRLYGAMGYRVFSFLFNWTDDRWERDLRDRQFMFAPVYVSAESMRWWLGRECFATQKCILSTKEEGKQEDVEDAAEDYYRETRKAGKKDDDEGDDDDDEGERRGGKGKVDRGGSIGRRSKEVERKHNKRPKGSTAWYDEHVPPFALWVAGSDDLVDGRRLLRRFERGREPHVRVVHAKVIEEYEHLDVIWAIDSIEQVGREVGEVLWKTCDVRKEVRTPRGCEDVGVWVPRERMKDFDGKVDDDEQSSSSSSERMRDVD